ncbi:ribonuclease E/G [Clostridium sp. Marseille-P299]|uniref:ribonuclease E/G n=1 Tax=Clostridium sp. Marseille-P299 TaxID=1805477 RepID=UPI0008359545|nr:ribonuclease E/G [Clostridium sp. Marseille-P299]
MGKKLIITKLNQKIISSLFEENELIQVNVEKEEEDSLLGNIYVGKVKNIVKNINAAFVEIEHGRMCYLSLNEVTHPIYTQEHKADHVRIGDELIVQISKEDVKTKAPVITTNINLTGKYVVLVHGKPGIGVSNKVENDKDRKRLRKLLEPFISGQYGFIIRTNACFVSEELIKNEIEVLLGLYENIKNYGIHRLRFSKIYETPKAYICSIRDGLSHEIENFITDDADMYSEMKEYLETYQKEDIHKLKLYTDPMLPLIKLYGIESKIENALKERVWLKSGGTLIIQPTEALVVIDVNTSKAVSGKKNVEETFLKINLEAAKEIAKQIRLRNLSGIIIVDFIDMKKEENKELLLNTLNEYLRQDPVKTMLIDMTALNLVEITRKKIRKPLYEQIK